MNGRHAIPELGTLGFELQAILKFSHLPSWVREPVLTNGFAVADGTRLVMLGQAGPSLWDSMESEGFEAHDRFDEFSVRCVTEWLGRDHPGGSLDVIYPGETPIPLGRLAEHVGWGRPSPLGLSIHHHYGPWIAHRIVFLTDVELTMTQTAHNSHPCDSCTDRPCLAECPAGAVGETGAFDIPKCASHRVQVDSGCAHQCLARNVCPIGQDHRYGDTQMRHHYGSGLKSIRKWVGQ